MGTVAESAARILVVDDEENVLDLVASVLRFAGYEVETAETGWLGLQAARRSSFDLVVLDVMLPDMTGFEVCTQLRSVPVIAPVLFLTARTDALDATEGLRIGGDDYVRKPFDVGELVARVEALLRRTSTASSETLSFDDLRVDLTTYQATRGEERLDLTPTEFRLLEVLVRNGGRILTRAQLLDLVWGDSIERDPALVDTVVSRLRRKLERDGSSSLCTRRGIGYGLLTER